MRENVLRKASPFDVFSNLKGLATNISFRKKLRVQTNSVDRVILRIRGLE